MDNYGGSDLVACPECEVLIPRNVERCPSCGKDFRSPERRKDVIDNAEQTGTPYSWADHRTCVKCGGVLEEGYLDDQFSKNAYIDLMWTSGDPADGELGESIDRRHFYVTALRCTRCGNLELKAVTKP